eukprot:1166277-Alexandrium_andersonii.AAC.1
MHSLIRSLLPCSDQSLACVAARVNMHEIESLALVKPLCSKGIAHLSSPCFGNSRFVTIPPPADSSRGASREPENEDELVEEFERLGLGPPRQRDEPSSSSAGSRPPRGEPCPRTGRERLYVVVRAPRGTSGLLGCWTGEWQSVAVALG